MPDRLVRRNAYLSRLTTALRERLATTLLATLCACGGGKHDDTYAKAQSAQQSCCEHLAGADRDRCLQQIVRVDQPDVAHSATNQSTFACVEEHFACDPHTGHATQQSAQSQMECLQDLR